jgi:hypothetical protein
MKRINVEASNVRSVGYDPMTKILEIEFKNGKIAQNKNVSQKTYDGLMNARSLGSYYNHEVLGIGNKEGDGRFTKDSQLNETT